MATLAIVMLAEQPAEEAFRRLIPWIAGLVGFVCLGTVLISIIRRSMRSGPDQSSEGFGLHDLRRLHASGQLTDEEFTRAKALIIGRHRSQTPPAESGPDNADDPSSEHRAEDA
jgi:hypothetical protein